MTGSPSTVGRSPPAEAESPPQASHSLSLTRSIRGLGFWAAIVLPAVYLPVLSLGIGTHTGAVFLGLLGCQLLALLAGHHYKRP
jgi:hypothetical protein